jgi:hypothetical protein
MRAGRRVLWAVAGALFGLAVVHFSGVADAASVWIGWAGPNNPPAVQADENGDYEFILRTTVISWVPVDLYVANTPGNNENVEGVMLTGNVHLGVGIGEYPTLVQGMLAEADEDGLNQLSAWDGTFYSGSGAFDKIIRH